VCLLAKPKCSTALNNFFILFFAPLLQNSRPEQFVMCALLQLLLSGKNFDMNTQRVPFQPENMKIVSGREVKAKNVRKKGCARTPFVSKPHRSRRSPARGVRMSMHGVAVGSDILATA